MEHRSMVKCSAPTLLFRGLNGVRAWNRTCLYGWCCFLHYWIGTRPIVSPMEISMTNNTQSRFGFVNFAETWNGRLAMLGFVIGLSTELLTGQGILSQLGFAWDSTHASWPDSAKPACQYCQAEVSWKIGCNVIFPFYCFHDHLGLLAWQCKSLMSRTMLALTLGNLELSNVSAAVLSLFSLLFVASFIFVSVKNDNEGLMKWMFNDPSRSVDDWYDRFEAFEVP